MREGLVVHGLKGIALAPPYGHWYANDRWAYPFYELAVDVDVPIWFHHSQQYISARQTANFGKYFRCPLKYAQLSILEDVLIDFPEMRCVVEHMGYPYTEELFALMVNHENLFTDQSLMVEPGEGRPKRRILMGMYLGMAREYGMLNRIMYGTDLGSTNPEVYVSHIIKEINFIEHELPDIMTNLGFPALTDKELEGLLSENAARFLRIDSHKT